MCFYIYITCMHAYVDDAVEKCIMNGWDGHMGHAHMKLMTDMMGTCAPCMCSCPCSYFLPWRHGSSCCVQYTIKCGCKLRRWEMQMAVGNRRVPCTCMFTCCGSQAAAAWCIASCRSQTTGHRHKHSHITNAHMHMHIRCAER